MSQNQRNIDHSLVHTNCYLASILLYLNLYRLSILTYFIRMSWLLNIVLNSVRQHNCFITYSMVQTPSWEANWFAASQEIPRISRNPKVYFRTHKRPPPVSILCQPNPVPIPTSHLLEIHPNIIHTSTPRSPQWSPSLRFPHQDPIHPPLLTHTRHMPSHNCFITQSNYTGYMFRLLISHLQAYFNQFSLKMLCTHWDPSVFTSKVYIKLDNLPRKVWCANCVVKLLKYIWKLLKNDMLVFTS